MIREMRIEDAHAVWKILTRSLGYDCNEDVVERQVERLASIPYHLCLVWLDDAVGKVAAFIQASEYETLHNTGGWNVINLAVAPERQGQGIGRELLFALEDRVRIRGGKFIRLNSRIERTEAHAFYERVGYVSDKTQRHFSKQLV